MATSYNIRCKNCGFEKEIVVGQTMSSERVSIPKFAPNNSPILDTAQLAILLLDIPWRKDGRALTDKEKLEITDLAELWQTRICNKCSSESIECREIGIVD